MAITIARTDVKRKCMVPAADTSLDSSIDSLILEMQPALEMTLDPVFLNDTANTALQAALKLGVLEIICAELLAQRQREPGYGEDVQVGGVRLGASYERGKALMAQGLARLAPFQMALGANPGQCPSLVAARPEERAFTAETCEGW